MNIEKVLPHRKPFLFVEKVTDANYMNYAKGEKVVGDDEFWVEGHFPNNPIFPGVLILELMAQVGGFIFANENSEMPDGKFAYLSKVDGLKLIHKVVPGDLLEVEAVLVESFMPYHKVKAVTKVKGKKVAEAEITYTFMKNL